LEMIDARGRCICAAAVGARSNQDHDVLTLLAIGVFDTEQHPVFLQTELRSLADREKRGMFFILRTNVVDHVFGLEDVLLASELLRFLGIGIGAEYSPFKTG